MVLEEAIYNILKTDSRVTALVAGRIFGGVIKQKVTTWPCIAYRPDGQKRVVRTLEGGCALVEQRIGIYSGGKTYGQAASTDFAIELALDEYTGTVTTSAASPEESLTLQGIFLDVPAHEYEFDDTTETHNFVSVYACHYIEPARLV